MKYLIIIILLTLTFWSCESTSEETARAYEPLIEEKSIEFELKDTVIQFENGVSIKLKANSFLDDKNKPVSGKITLKANFALTPSEMVLAGLSTVGEEGLLKSNGMFKLDALNEDGSLNLNLAATPEISLPMSVVDKDINLFEQVETDSGKVWKQIAKPLNTAAINQIAGAKALYMQNCAQCHDLVVDIVGPHLGNVTKRRDMDWLIKFTRYPEKTIQSGDPTAFCLYEEYASAGYMPNHDAIPDSTIISIYDYITVVSKKHQKLLDSLDETGVTKCVFETEEEKERWRLPAPSVVVTTTVPILRTWCNLDTYLRTTGEKSKPANLELTIKDFEGGGYTYIRLVYPEINVIVFLERAHSTPKQVYVSPFKEYPLDRKCFLVAERYATAGKLDCFVGEFDPFTTPKLEIELKESTVEKFKAELKDKLD